MEHASCLEAQVTPTIAAAPVTPLLGAKPMEPLSTDVSVADLSAADQG